MMECGMRRQGSGDLAAAAGGLGATARPMAVARSNSGLGLSSPHAFKHQRRPSCPKALSAAACRMALSENVMPGEERTHRRQNSLSSALEGLDIEAVFPSENDDVQVAPPPTPCPASGYGGDHRAVKRDSIKRDTKTARRRAEYDSKRKGVTFNQRKHQSPSYMRRLERRKEALQGRDASFSGGSVAAEPHSGMIASPFEMCQA